MIELNCQKFLNQYLDKKILIKDNKPEDNPEIKNYINKINEITRTKRK